MSEETEEAIGDVLEDVIRNIIQVFGSGYAIIFGFPGYLVSSVVNSSIGYIDATRFPRTREAGYLTSGYVETIWIERTRTVAINNYVQVNLYIQALRPRTASNSQSIIQIPMYLINRRGRSAVAPFIEVPVYA